MTDTDMINLQKDIKKSNYLFEANLKKVHTELNKISGNEIDLAYLHAIMWRWKSSIDKCNDPNTEKKHAQNEEEIGRLERTLTVIKKSLQQLKTSKHDLDVISPLITNKENVDEIVLSLENHSNNLQKKFAYSKAIEKNINDKHRIFFHEIIRVFSAAEELGFHDSGKVSAGRGNKNMLFEFVRNRPLNYIYR